MIRGYPYFFGNSNIYIYIIYIYIPSKKNRIFGTSIVRKLPLRRGTLDHLGGTKKAIETLAGGSPVDESSSLKTAGGFFKDCFFFGD